MAKDRLVECIASTPEYAGLRESTCAKGRLRQMTETFVLVELYAHCKGITVAAGLGVNRMNRKLLKVSSRV